MNNNMNHNNADNYMPFNANNNTDNYMPFSIDDNMAFNMSNNQGYSMNYPMEYANKMEKMYPDSYKMIYPHVQDTVNSVNDEHMYTMSEIDLDRLTEETIRKSNMVDDPPVGHNSSTLHDLARVLIARDLIDRHRRRGQFSFFPLFFFPFDHHRQEQHRYF